MRKHTFRLYYDGPAYPYDAGPDYNDVPNTMTLPFGYDGGKALHKLPMRTLVAASIDSAVEWLTCPWSNLPSLGCWRIPRASSC